MDGRRDDSALDPEIADLLAEWQALRGADPMPAPEALDPTALRRFLSRLFLVDGESVETLRVRLAGTAYRQIYGREVTGEGLLEVLPAERQDVRQDYKVCFETAAPVTHKGEMDWRDSGAPLPYQRILLPFGRDGVVSRILGFAVFYDTKGRRLFR